MRRPDDLENDWDVIVYRYNPATGEITVSNWRAGQSSPLRIAQVRNWRFTYILAQQPQSTPPSPIKLYIAGGYYVKTVEKQCPKTVTVTTTIHGAQNRLELAQTAKWFKEHGSLYKVDADEELAKFAAARGSEFAKQICRYFESPKP
jgi:hypothetical protein